MTKTPTPRDVRLPSAALEADDGCQAIAPLINRHAAGPAPTTSAPTADLERIPEPTAGRTYCEAQALGEPWHPAGCCAVCGEELVGAQIRYCGKGCRKWWRDNHRWSSARSAALRRDRRCVRRGCDSRDHDPVEVNHILPLAITAGSPSHGETGCHNHQYNLETLCVPHHRETTREQMAEAHRG